MRGYLFGKRSVRQGLLGGLLALCCLFSSAFGAIESDRLLASLKPSGYVNDYARVFTPEQQNGLERRLAGVAGGGGPEVVVVALSSLEGGEMDDFANKLFERWGIGKKGKDNGVLLIAAIQDRVLRIEVGYGLEGELTDAGAGRIRDAVIVPQFKAGRYAEGLIEGAQAIVNVVAPDSAQATAKGLPKGREERETPGWMKVLFFLFILYMVIRHPRLLLLLLLSRGRGGRGGGGGFGGFGGGRSGGGGAGGSW
ncbi:MAG: TPM domain-containing protein [Kiritimatiellae bacterium]|nr:TPM domain-containing protein [Kiritimatiellia bacterium]MDD4736937.1 TPM domain-containing protein [Kiritimatiellia bacterium]